MKVYERKDVTHVLVVYRLSEESWRAREYWSACRDPKHTGVPFPKHYRSFKLKTLAQRQQARELADRLEQLPGVRRVECYVGNGGYF
jgi:hypothetical protein